MREKIGNEDYSWLRIKDDKKKHTNLFKLIDINLNCKNLVEEVKELNAKEEKIKKLKDAPDSE